MVVTVMVMNDRLTPLSCHVNQPSHSSNKAISNLTLKLQGQVWWKGKTLQSAQYIINLLSFRFTSIWQQYNNCRDTATVKIQTSAGSWVSHKVHPVSNRCTSYSFHINWTNHSWDMFNRVLDLEGTHPKIWQQKVSNRIPPKLIR